MPRSSVRVVFLAACWLGLWVSAPAQAQYRRIYDLAAHPLVAGIVYAATQDGVYKSLDAGRTWRPATQGLSRQHIRYIAVHPRGRWVAAATEDDSAVYQSTDGGGTWRVLARHFARAGYPVPIKGIGFAGDGESLLAFGNRTLLRISAAGQIAAYPCPSLTDREINSVATVQGQPGMLLLGVGEGHTVALARTSDGGKTWEWHREGLRGATFPVLAALPPEGREVVAGLADADFAEYLLKSTDGGRSWTPARVMGKRSIPGSPESIALDPDHPQTLFLCTNHEWNGEIYSSEDGGQSWQDRTDGLPELGTYGRVVVTRGPGKAVLVVTSGSGGNSLFRSTNGGQTWQEAAAGIPIRRLPPGWAQPRRSVPPVSAVAGWREASLVASAPALAAPAGGKPMWQKVEDLVIYKEKPFYSSFPAAVTLPDGDVLVMFRRAPDPRAMLPEGAPDNLRGWISHVNERSHHALVRLDVRTLKPKGPVQTLPLNPLAADQDSSLLLMRDGRLLLGSFAWYGFPPPFLEQMKPQVFGLHGGPQNDGLYYAFFGGFTRLSEDGGHTWSEHNYLPPMAGMPPAAGPFPRRGGAVRGRMVEAGDEILLPAYASSRVDTRDAAHCYASRDGGKTWEYRAVVAADPENKVAMHEPAFHRCPSGKIVCFLRTANLGDHLVTTESTDNGHTWSPWKQRDVIGHPYNPLPLPGGGVLLVYGYRHAPFGIRARVLDDECTDSSGPEIVLRDDGPGPDLGYPWATALPDGRVLATYYIAGADGVRYIGGTVLERR